MEPLDALGSGSDVLLPSQYYDKDKATRTPIGRLMLAILEDALRCLQRRGMGTRSNLAAEEAYDWLYGAGTGIFSFDGVCDYLGIEPEYLRKGLKDWDGARLARRAAVNGAGGARPTISRERGTNNKRRYPKKTGARGDAR